MAIPVINSQGTQVYILDLPGTAWADCSEAVTAIKAGDLVGCPQSLGEITETREMTEYKCLSSDESAKSLGAISRGSMDIGLLFDPDDIAGQEALKTAFLSNTPVIIGIELPDQITPTTGNGTLFWFEALVSSTSIVIAQDEAVLYNVTVEIASSVTECSAT